MSQFQAATLVGRLTDRRGSPQRTPAAREGQVAHGQSPDSSWSRTGHSFGELPIFAPSNKVGRSHYTSRKDLPLAQIVLDPSRHDLLEAELVRDLGSGDPLAAGFRDRAQGISSRPLPDLRVHSSDPIRRNVDLLDSHALTIGRDVLLGSPPNGRREDWLLAHEVAHTIQQSAVGSEARLASRSAAESEADAFADAFVQDDDSHVHTAHELSPAPVSIAQKVIWKHIQDLPGNLLLIIDVDDGDFVGGCVREIVPHAGVKLIQKTPHLQLFNLHVGFVTNAPTPRNPLGEFCIFFYESVTGICEKKCFPSKEELERALDEVLEWLKDLLERVLQALAIAVLVIGAVILAYIIAQALAAALLVLLAA